MPVQKPTGMHRKARLRETHTTSMHAAPSGILNRSGEVTVVEGPAGLVQKLDFSLHLESFNLQAHQEEVEKRATRADYWEYNLRILRTERRGRWLSQHPQGSLQRAYAFCTWPELQKARIIVNNTLPMIIEEKTETWKGEMLTGCSLPHLGLPNNHGTLLLTVHADR